MSRFFVRFTPGSGVIRPKYSEYFGSGSEARAAARDNVLFKQYDSAQVYRVEDGRLMLQESVARTWEGVEMTTYNRDGRPVSTRQL